MRGVLLVIMFFSSLTAYAEDKNKDPDIEFMHSTLINAKLAGTCGAYKQMADFQAVTKMPGGDEFVNRFGATELARLGMTAPQFLELCEKAINNYNAMSNMSQQ